MSNRMSVACRNMVAKTGTRPRTKVAVSHMPVQTMETWESGAYWRTISKLMVARRWRCLELEGFGRAFGGWLDILMGEWCDFSRYSCVFFFAGKGGG